MRNHEKKTTTTQCRVCGEPTGSPRWTICSEQCEWLAEVAEEITRDEVTREVEARAQKSTEMSDAEFAASWGA